MPQQKKPRARAKASQPKKTQAEIERIKYQLWAQDPHVRLAAAGPRRRLVAEGDSWFDYPVGLDILDNLKREHGYEIYKVAHAGDSLENMSYGTEIRGNFSRRQPQLEETLQAIRKHQPKVFLLSAGGNDLAGNELESYLDHKLSGRAPLRLGFAQYMFFTVFTSAYEYILTRVWDIDPAIHVIAHGYGNAIPDGRPVRIIGIPFSGPWLRPAMAKKGITDPVEARGVMTDLLEMFNRMVAQLGAAHPNFHYIDLRPRIADDDWENELHLTDDAYRRVAAAFHAEIRKYV